MELLVAKAKMVAKAKRKVLKTQHEGTTKKDNEGRIARSGAGSLRNE